jgi:hypothetical protein
MINNGYLAVNSEKTIFKKTKGSDYIIHGLFFYDMMHISSCNELKKEFMDKYSKDIEIRGGGLMKTFLGMEVEQSGTTVTIKLHLDCYPASPCGIQSLHQEDAAPQDGADSDIAWCYLEARGCT